MTCIVWLIRKHKVPTVSHLDSQLSWKIKSLSFTALKIRIKA